MWSKFVHDERGTITAEFAIVLPAVLIVLGLAIGGILIAAQRVTLVSLAAEVARLEARGDTDVAAARLHASPLDTVVNRRHDGSLLCVSLAAQPGNGPLAVIVVQTEACAAVSG